jgi:hypothetical protein
VINTRTAQVRRTVDEECILDLSGRGRIA